MNINIRHLGLTTYEPIWRSMQQFTQDRDQQTKDELWVTEHIPIYTLGLNGKPEHLLSPGLIPVLSTDRGGQVTYHGPGQVVVYTLFDINRLKINIRQMVSLLEQSMINTLGRYQIHAYAKADAPGVYVDEKKIGSIGLRIKKHCSYHGLSLNNNMDLTPFDHINTCGYPGLQVTQLADQGIFVSNTELAASLTQAIHTALST